MRGKAGDKVAALSRPGITPACAGKRPSTAPRHRVQWDHPRVCGEKLWTGLRSPTDLGSPPRVRGKVIWQLLAPTNGGITPACAGKSIRSAPSSVLFWDHPRVCGEKDAYTQWKAQPKGSPPRVRGKVAHHPSDHPVNGITPACAGKRGSSIINRIGNRDHPRVCGEKHFPHGISITLRGSPPRVRGKGEQLVELLKHSGITPACAGKRIPRCSKRNTGGDHPRVCGEKLCPPLEETGNPGSPPRVRGKVSYHMKGMAADRITPACAGKSAWLLGDPTAKRDHPRVCGEKEWRRFFLRHFLGSPPRVRGKAPVRSSPALHSGITPACAGKRISGSRTRRHSRDHPRVCGEKLLL